MKSLLVTSLLALATWSSVTQTHLPSKSELKKIALKESQNWERSLSLKGLHSITQRRTDAWGLKAIDSTYKKALGTGKISNVRAKSFAGLPQKNQASLSRKPFSMMDMNRMLYDFMDEHKVYVKSQADTLSHIRYSLYQRKDKSSLFDVKLKKEKDGSKIVFSSNSPYMKKSISLDKGRELREQMLPFLNKSYKTWRSFRSRMLRDVPTDKSSDLKKKENLFEIHQQKNVSNDTQTQKLTNTLSSTTKTEEETKVIITTPHKQQSQPSPIPLSQSQKPQKKNTAHFVDSLDNINPDSRKLLDMGDIKMALEGVLDDRLKLHDEDQQKWFVTLANSNDSESLDRICLVSAEIQDSGEIVVSMDNNDIDSLKNSQKFVNKVMPKDGNSDDLAEFFKEELAEYVGIYMEVLEAQMNVEKMAGFIKEEVFKPKGIELLENSKTFSQSNPSEVIFMVLDHVDAQEGQIITQLRVYKVNHLYNQVQISHRERQIDLQVPRHMGDAQKAQLSNEIGEVLSDDVINNTIGFKESVQIIADSLKNTHNCSAVEEQSHEGHTSIIEINDDTGCPFSGMSLVVTGFDYDYLQYLHILLDNQYFQAEHLVAYTLEGDFKSNVEDVLEGMASNIQSVQTHAGQPIVGNLSLDDLTKSIESVLGNEVERLNLNEHEILYKRKTEHGKEMTVVRILVVPGDGEGDNTDLYRVFLFDPSGHKKGLHHTKSQHEYMMSASNGQDELKIFTGDLAKWKKKLEHRKLKKI